MKSIQTIIRAIMPKGGKPDVCDRRDMAMSVTLLTMSARTLC